MNTASCARPACSAKPAAWLAYDYEARCAWLDDDPVPATDPSQHWPLCERHADSLRVPRGWFCVDRRTSGPSDERAADGSGGTGPAGPTPAGGQLSAIL